MRGKDIVSNKMKIGVSRRMIWVLLPLLWSLPLSTNAQTTINAASCSSTDVQTALNSVAADNTTVILPVCTSAQNVQWTATVTYNQVFSTVIQGQGTTSTPDSLGNPTVYNDQTVILTLCRTVPIPLLLSTLPRTNPSA